MPFLEDLNSQARKSDPPADALQDLSKPEVNESIRSSRRGVAGLEKLPVVALSSQDEPVSPRDLIVQSLVDSLKKTGELLPESETTDLVRRSIKHELHAAGKTAADSLADAVSKKLPNGMKLKISEDSKLQDIVNERFPNKPGVVRPDYARYVELIDKDGKSLGKKVGMVMRSSVQELAIELGNDKKLSPDNWDVTQALKREVKKHYELGGAEAADKLAGAISKDLPDGMKLKIEDDKEFREEVVRQAKENGDPIPKYVRSMQLVDKDGKLLGKAIGISIQEPEKKPKVPSRINV